MKIVSKITSFIFLTILFIFSAQVNAESVQEKKLTFFEHIYPFIEQENISILKTRKHLRKIKTTLSTNQPLTEADQALLKNLAKEYSVSKKKKKIKDTKSQIVDKLLVRIDVIPPSLALAQSANESAWGKSRFAQQAHNYFGQWCFTKGCGIVPSQRDANSKHEVRRFKSAQESVSSYIKNINTTRAYSALRKMRHKSRQDKLKPDGHKLAEGLIRYSSRGKAYVKEIRSMIKFNKLNKYDERFWSAVKAIKI